MKVTLRQIFNARQPLDKLSSQALSAPISWRIGIVIRKLADAYVVCEKERTKLVVKYGETNKKGDSQVLPEKMAEFMVELNKLLDEETEIEIKKIALLDLEKADMTPSEMLLLEPFIQE